MHIALKVKIKSLAAEARIIRAEEHKLRFEKKPRRVVDHRDASGETFVYRRPRRKLDDGQREALLSLQSHRRFAVRSEARHSLLAYAYVRGMSYVRVESKAYTVPNTERVAQMVKRFNLGSNELPATADAIAAWMVESVERQRAA